MHPSILRHHSLSHLRTFIRILIVILTVPNVISQSPRPDEPVERDIWVFTGQSNSQGWALAKAAIEPDFRVTYFNDRNEWVPAVEPLNDQFAGWTPGDFTQNILLQRFQLESPGNMNIPANPNANGPTFDSRAQGGVGPALLFAKHLLESSDRPIGLLSCGLGSPIKRWDPALRDDPDSLYGRMLNKIELAKSKGSVKGVIWWQGESDAMTPGAADVYETALLNLLDRLRMDIGNPELAVIIVQSGRFVHPHDTLKESWEKIRESQRRAARARANTHLLASHDLMLEDSIHIGFEGYLRQSRRLAEIALTKVYRQSGHGSPIDVESIELLQPESRRPMIRVRFSGVSGSLRINGLPSGFELRGPDGDIDPARNYPSPPEDVAVPVIYRVDVDPTDSSAILLGVFDSAPIFLGKSHPLAPPLRLICGAGLDPGIGIVDELDMPIPAFGPTDLFQAVVVPRSETRD